MGGMDQASAQDHVMRTPAESDPPQGLGRGKTTQKCSLETFPRGQKLIWGITKYNSGITRYNRGITRYSSGITRYNSGFTRYNTVARDALLHIESLGHQMVPKLFVKLSHVSGPQKVTWPISGSNMSISIGLYCWGTLKIRVHLGVSDSGH